MVESRPDSGDRTQELGGPGGVSLPTGWDFGRDLAVLVGGAAAALGAWFESRGQVRLLVVATEDVPGLPPNAVRVGSEPDLVLEILRLDGALPAHVVVQRTPDPWATAERHREVAEWLTRALLSRRVQAETVARSGAIWLLQGLENLAHLAEHASIAPLRGAFRGRPAVLVSPGPSLSRNIDQLPGLADKALILAGTHALGALEKVGVLPHLLLLADAGDLVRHLAGCALEKIEALLVAATCRQEAFELPARRLFSFAGNGNLDDWIFDALGEDAGLATGGSVACSALSLALFLECDPIVFVGQDLSFTEEGYYAPGTLDEDASVVLQGDGFYLRKPAGSYEPGLKLEDGGVRFTGHRPVLHLPGYHGGTVLSTQMFQSFHTWFEAVALSVSDRVHLLNCTEGGARIRGMEQLELSSASAAWEPFDESVGAVLDRATRDHAPGARRERLRERVDAMVAALDPCLELARRCSLLATQAEDLEELGRAEKELSRALKPVQFFSLIAQDKIIAAQEQARTARDMAANLLAARTLFDVVERSARLLRDPLARALVELEGRG